MPCDASHCEPHNWEREISKVACLLDELAGKKWSKQSWEGYHPKVYSVARKPDGDAMTAELCAKLQTVDVTKYSLEMQIWWRDHQEADRKKAKQKLEKQETEKAKAAALAKLTPHERKLLGL